MGNKQKAAGKAPLEIAKGQRLRITAERDGYRRAGMAHTKAGVDHPADAFTPEQLKALQDDPRIALAVIGAKAR